MKYLVTGCAGFIGSTLTDALLADGHEIVGLDCFTDYYDPAIKQRNLGGAAASDAFHLLRLDLASEPLPDHALEVDGIFHLAAQAGVRASWGREFDTYTQCNVLATQRLLEANVARARRTGERPAPVVYASSSSVYGNAEARPTREDALPAPISPYGVTKLAAEHLCDTYRHEFDVPATSLRFFTVYGPRQRPDMAFHKFVRAALQGDSIDVYGDGTQSRDFTFVDDIVAANRSAMDVLQGGASGGTYNLGGGSTATVREVIELLERILERPVAVTYGATQPGDVRHTSADTSAAQRELGYKPRTSLETGLRSEADWLRDLLAAN
jgi:UDP-glucose 4-epimerase